MSHSTSPAAWQQLKELFTRIADLPDEQRAAAIDAGCAGDAELRRNLESLLDADRRASAFIAQPAYRATPQSLPETIGRYRITSEIGHGGMGIVYRAQRDGEFRQDVAIKVIRAGMAVDPVIRRFTTERQILAELEHPNVARLLDGGTTAEGLPYFVMEYVDGVPIDRYCEEHRLSVRERLELFRQVCSAVQAAHQRLVVHRDLKPSNILVTRDGIPKLLDFGIAKLLDDPAAGETLTEHRVMTPEYASPEQVLGRPVTTAADVYALGIVLFELVTGEKPYRLQTRSPMEIARTIAETEPLRASVAADRSRARELRGDVDVILARALHKDPARRYASAEALADDLRRHLEGLPVLARPDSLRYRAAKFVRRNAALVAAGALVVIALVGGMILVARQAAAARAAQQRAERRFADLRELARVLIFELEPEIGELEGSTRTREKIVANALRYLDRLAREADDPQLQIELAAAYRQIGAVQGNPLSSNLGQQEAALASYAKARRVLERVAATRGADAPLTYELSANYSDTADVLVERGELTEAERHYATSIALFERASRLHRPSFDQQRAIADTIAKRADVLGFPGRRNLGRSDESRAEARRALALRQQLFRQRPDHDGLRGDLIDGLTTFGFLETRAGHYAAAADAYRQSLDIMLDVARRNPDSAVHRQDLALAYLNTARALRETGTHAEALRMAEECAAIMRRLAAADPSSALWRRNLTVVHNEIAEIHTDAGDAAEAIEASRKAIAGAEAAWRADRRNTAAALDLVIALRRGLGALELQRRHAELVRQARYALDVVRTIDLSEDARARFEQAVLRARLGRALVAEGQTRAGVAELAAGREALEQRRREKPGDVVEQEEVATILHDLGKATNDCAALRESRRLFGELRAAGKLRARNRGYAEAAAAANCG